MKRVVVTRATTQTGSLVERIGAMGHRPVVVPLIAIADAEDGGAALRAALVGLPDRFDWIAVTSPNGAAAIGAAMGGRPLDTSVAVAAVGPGTAAALRALGLSVSLLPDRSIAEGLLDALSALTPARILLVQAADARPVLAHGLRAGGWDVTAVIAYRSVPVVASAADLAAAGGADAIVFTSSSTVSAWVAAGAATPPVVVSIGPATTATALRSGISVTMEASPHTIDGVAAALALVLGPAGSGSPAQ